MTAKTFAELGVSDDVIERLGERGITDAFPIQAATIEAALAGRDICGKAPTGSGKTLAFGVPVVQLVEPGTSRRPRALILAPTRELATQIKDEIEPLATAHDRSMLTVFGGTNIERDIRRLQQGVDILVACPGRLEDLIARHCCDLRDVDVVVVDEADRMADMGFLVAVKRLLDQTAADRHTMLFSATLDGDVDTLIKRYQTDPLTVSVEDISEPGDVEHSWYLIQPTDRTDSAVAVLRGYYSSIVFCRTRRGCERVAKMFVKRGLNAVAIHGDRSQSQRERALENFTSGKAQILVATDVAARGIHVDNVALVMHYDPAGSDKDYIHRSGRTGRAGQDGRVISMVVEDKKKVARQLQKDLGFKPGFDELDLESLPTPIDRPRPEPRAKPEPAPERRGGSRGQGRQSDRSAGQRQRGSGDRDRKGGGYSGGKSDERDDRRGGPKSRKHEGDRRPGGSRRTKSKRGGADWYPPGYHDDEPSGPRKRKSSGGRTTNKRDDRDRPKRGSSTGRTTSKRAGRDDRDRQVPPAGGSGTTKNKSRAAKGRHADKTSTKDKGKRRYNRSR